MVSHLIFFVCFDVVFDADCGLKFVVDSVCVSSSVVNVSHGEMINRVNDLHLSAGDASAAHVTLKVTMLTRTNSINHQVIIKYLL